VEASPVQCVFLRDEGPLDGDQRKVVTSAKRVPGLTATS
jgi:hypothetical protein